MARRSYSLSQQDIQLLQETKQLSVDEESVWKNFIKSKIVQGVSNRTIDRYEMIRHVVFRDLLVLDMKQKLLLLEEVDIQNLIVYWKPLVAITTINGRLRVLRTFYLYCCSKGYLASNPMQQIKKMKEPQVLKDTLDSSEISSLLAYLAKQKTFASYRDATIIKLLLDTGIRLNEMVNIRIQDIQDDALVITRGKGGKQRRVFLSSPMQEALVPYLKVRGEVQNDFLFITVNGDCMVNRTFQERLQRYLKGAGITKHITAHSFRRTFAKYAAIDGVDAFTLAALMGHSSIEMTSHYVQLYGKEMKQQVKKLNSISSNF